MKKIFYFIVFIAAVFIFAAYSNASEEYVIQKGDSLWSISNNKLQDSFFWPKVWKFNPQIKDPDRIYPGEKIRIPSMDELMSRPASQPEGKQASGAPAPAEKQAVKPLEVISKKPGNYMVDNDRFIASGWIADKPCSNGKILASTDGRTLIGKSDLVYLKTDTGSSVGDKFFVIKNVKKIKHPQTGSYLGDLITVSGIVEVMGKDDGVPKAEVISSFEEIDIGDTLCNYEEMEAPAVPASVRTPEGTSGYIVETYSTSSATGKPEIIFVDKGTNDGLQAGDVFTIYNEVPIETSLLKKSKTIKNPIGSLQILALQPKTSKAIIVRSDEEVMIGDVWGKRSDLAQDPGVRLLISK